MRVFVGFGYNERDQWIQDQVSPILRGLGFTVVSGKDMHGEELQDEVKSRIDQSDAVIGFFTIREGQGEADFTSHIWVRDETMYALARDKPIVLVREEGVRVPDGLFGDRQYVPYSATDRLACVVELVEALGTKNMRRVKLDPEEDALRRDLRRWRRDSSFVVRYHTQDQNGMESDYRDGRLELVDQGFYLNVSDIPKGGYLEVEGVLNGSTKFSSGWVSADAVTVKVG